MPATAVSWPEQSEHTCLVLTVSSVRWGCSSHGKWLRQRRLRLLLFLLYRLEPIRAVNLFCYLRKRGRLGSREPG